MKYRSTINFSFIVSDYQLARVRVVAVAGLSVTRRHVLVKVAMHQQRETEFAMSYCSSRPTQR